MNLGRWPNDQILKAMKICRAYGLEAAKAVLGHADPKVTEIYAERNIELAMRVMPEMG